VFDVDYGFLRNSFFFVERLLGFHKNTNKYLKRLDKILSAYSTEVSPIWCNHGNWQGKLEYAPKEQYGKGVMMKFEGIDVRVPEKYDEYLTQKYGDWRADLPKEKQVGHHYYSVMDLNRPYTYYMENK
jgi:lipopolysaccharide cholinephosphotransferase